MFYSFTFLESRYMCLKMEVFRLKNVVQKILGKFFTENKIYMCTWVYKTWNVKKILLFKIWIVSQRGWVSFLHSNFMISKFDFKETDSFAIFTNCRDEMTILFSIIYTQLKYLVPTLACFFLFPTTVTCIGHKQCWILPKQVYIFLLTYYTPGSCYINYECFFNSAVSHSRGSLINNPSFFSVVEIILLSDFHE